MGTKHKWGSCPGQQDATPSAVVAADGEIWAVFACKYDAAEYAAGGTFSESDAPKVRPVDEIGFAALPDGGPIEVTTDLERRLLAALGGFIGVSAQVPTLAAAVFRAAELHQGDVEAAFKPGGQANIPFNCVMWNLANDAIGKAMQPHTEIQSQLADAKRRRGDKI